MKNKLILGLCLLVLASACNEERSGATTNASVTNEHKMKAKNTDAEISCKLTSGELQKRKETVIASLKTKILDKKELSNGFSYKFSGEDGVVDELAEFVKSERSCCSFFVFTLSFSGDGKESWLTLEGPPGSKDMIVTEIGL